MIAKCLCSPDAAAELRKLVGFGGDGQCAVELEFRELPYFLVSRSREQWTEARGDINSVRIAGVAERGLIVDPAIGGGGAVRRTLIPWANIISLTVEPAES